MAIGTLNITVEREIGRYNPHGILDPMEWIFQTADAGLKAVLHENEYGNVMRLLLTTMAIGTLNITVDDWPVISLSLFINASKTILASSVPTLDLSTSSTQSALNADSH